MKYRHIMAIPVLGLALGNAAHAGYMPTLGAVGDGWVAPLAQDWQFDQRGLSAKVAGNNVDGYTLSVTGKGNFTFGMPSSDAAYAGNSTSYTLTAHFNSAGIFDSTGSSLSIYGTLSGKPDGSSALPGNKLLYTASLTDFGYNKGEASIAFKTSFDGSSWATNPDNKFTGGSTGEVVYLFDQVGLNNGGHGRLTSLINALDAGDLSTVSGRTFTGVESIASVPLPLPAVLFGTGLLGMLGLGRKGRGNAEAV